MISFAISAKKLFFILGVAPTYPSLHKLGLKMALLQVLLFFFLRTTGLQLKLFQNIILGRLTLSTL